jgi:hypothetical protein
MKLTLRNFFRVNELMDIDCHSEGLDAESFRGAATVGLYSRLRDVTVGLFACGGRLFVWLDGEIMGVNDGLAVAHAASGSEAKLIVRCGQESYSIEYARGFPVSTIYYSEDDEDADFGLWISNVLNSEERKQIFLNGWRSAAP